MNNAQLDMVLEYLNEGTEINEYDYMIESLDEMAEFSINESNMITSLLEEDNFEKAVEKTVKSQNVFEKVKEAIKRFINWVKTLITKLKLKIRQLSVKLISKQVKKAVEKQKQIAKDLDPNSTITVGSVEYLILAHAGDVISSDTNEILVAVGMSGLIDKISKDNFKENIKEKLAQLGLNLFSKLPYPLFALDAKLANKFGKKIAVPKEDRTMTVEDYVDYLDELPGCCDNVSKVLDECLKTYDESIKFANNLYKNADKLANETLSAETKLINTASSLSVTCIRLELKAIKMSKRALKGAKSSKEKNDEE